MIRGLIAATFSLAFVPVGSVGQVAMSQGGAAEIAAISACGGTTAPNAGSTMAAGSVTEGRGATGCTITFRRPLLNGHCTVASPTGGTITAYTEPVTTELVVRNTRDTGNTIVWNCR